MNYEIFIRYSRKDNVPQQPADTKGWVTALRDEILADHRRFSTEPLRIFFDTDDIRHMDDWRHRILEGLRHSRILGEKATSPSRRGGTTVLVIMKLCQPRHGMVEAAPTAALSETHL